MILTFSRTSLKFLEKREHKTREVILEAIRKLPDEGDIKKLQGQIIKNTYRLRVGRYRVVYAWEGNAIKILRIDTRGDIYK